MKKSKELFLSDAEMAVLPLVPLILCAKADGGVSQEEQRTIIEAAIEWGIDSKDPAIDLIVKLINTDLNKLDLTYLYAINSLLDEIHNSNDDISLDQILEWSARVCASTYESGKSLVSKKESAMLNIIAEKLGVTDFKEKIKNLEKIIVNRIPELTKSEMHAELMAIIGDMPAGDSTESESEPAPGKFGRLLGFFPWEKIHLVNDRAENYDKKTFLQYLACSMSLNKNEKKQIIKMFGDLSQFQIDGLIEIFKEEIQKFSELADSYPTQVYTSEYRHNIEWFRLYAELTDK